MINEVKSLLDQYWNWLRTNTELNLTDDLVEITTPYLDRHNDCLQIYVKALNNGEILLTDDGYTIEDLEMSGFSIDSTVRSALFSSILNGFGVNSMGSALEIKTSKEEFGVCKHNLIQAILAVDDMFYLASPSVPNLFLRDVSKWLDQSHIEYDSSIKLTGKSGFNHRFDFLIPKSNSHPERVLRSINRPDKNSAQGLAFSWIDTKGKRSDDAQAYAILNDNNFTVPTNVIDALNEYEVNSIKWSERHKVQTVFTST